MCMINEPIECKFLLLMQLSLESEKIVYCCGDSFGMSAAVASSSYQPHICINKSSLSVSALLEHQSGIIQNLKT